MLKFTEPPTSIGLEHSSNGIKSACLMIRGKKPVLKNLLTCQTESEDVKQLYIDHPIITTGLDGKEVLVRPLRIPLTKDKDIEAALTFQMEPLLPYAIDEAFLAYQVVSKTEESSDLTVLAARKEALVSHLQIWNALEIEPEKIACVPSALSQFGSMFLHQVKSCLILHLQDREMTCILLKEGQLVASFALVEGLNILLEAQVKEDLTVLPQTLTEWQKIAQQKRHLAEALKRLQREVTKMGYALAKESKGETIEGIALTGSVAEWAGLSSFLVEPLSLPLLSCEPHGEFSSQELLSYAVPIGLGLASLPGQARYIDFRQQEHRYPHPWQRLKKPLLIFYMSAILLSGAFYFFSQQYLHYQEDQSRQTYLDLLAGMHKSHEQFELAFLAKNPHAKDSSHDEISAIKQLQQPHLIDRLAFLQKEIQGTPDSFPLYANIPRVSDVLAWLSQHSAVSFLDEEGKSQARLQIENFSYTMLKRPQQGKKQEKYQVKIELEFSSPTPKWAREFHDALIAPNDWVDPKGEVKWNSNRGRYKTSFFLKDKTVYPSA